MHQFKQQDLVRWRTEDEVCIGWVVAVNKNTARVIDEYDDVYTLRLSGLTYLPPIVLDREAFRSFARLESEPGAVLGDNVAQNIQNAQNYPITLDDVVCAFARLLTDPPEETARDGWLQAMTAQLTQQEKQAPTFDREAVARWMLTAAYSTWGGYCEEGARQALDEGRRYLADLHKPAWERRYPRDLQEQLLELLDDDAALDAADGQTLALYRSFAEALAREGHPLGLRAVGYGCYGGNRAFDCDWQRSRDHIQRLFEITDAMPERAYLANTLGYIYYYGRCNGGQPQYAQAYTYFSFAAFNGIYEACYKVADMYLNGYGVVRSPKTHDRMICELYRENLKYIRAGHFDCKFADVALRMGRMYAQNTDEPDYEEALYHYLQARFAIGMRMHLADHYGDARVAENIQAAITGVKEAMGFRRRKSVRYFTLAGLLDATLTDGGQVSVLLEQRGECTYRVTLRAPLEPGRRHRKKLFVTVPRLELCGLLSKLTLTYEAHRPLSPEVLGRELTVDAIFYNEFSFRGQTVLETEGSFVLRAPGGLDRTRRFVSVRFGDSRLYDYLCDDPGVAPGDPVRVDAAGEERTVTVCRVAEKTPQELPLPLSCYKTAVKA